jgi:putative peptide zinc metalloprotease protein
MMPLIELRGLGERLIVDTSEGKPVYILVGENGTYLRLSKNTHHLLQQISRGVSFDQLADAICRQSGKQVSAAEVEAAYQKVMSRIAEIDSRDARLQGAFWFRRRLVPAHLVSMIANRLAIAFHPAIVAVSVVAIIMVVVWTAQQHMHVDPNHFGASYGLFVASLLTHEVGHASACARYGAKPSDIGITIYFIYPSFYCDVSSAWELKRWQRVAVDLGGVYFQLLFGVGCAIAYAFTRWEPLAGTLVFIAGSCLFSLNPILKFDGYWVVADALGVTNLARQPARIARHLVSRLRGEDVKKLPWPPVVSVMLVVYSLAGIGFWTWFLWRLFPSIWLLTTRYVTTIAPTFIAQLLAASSSFPSWASIWDFSSATFSLLFLLVMVSRLFAPVIRSFRQMLGRLRFFRRNRQVVTDRQIGSDLGSADRIRSVR